MMNKNLSQYAIMKIACFLLFMNTLDFIVQSPQ